MFNKADDSHVTGVFSRINTNLIALITVVEQNGVLPTDEQMTHAIEVPIFEVFESQLKQSLDAIRTQHSLNTEEKREATLKQRNLLYKKMSYITHPDRINSDTLVFANTAAQAFKDTILKLATLLPLERRAFLKTRAHTALESRKELPFCIELEISGGIEGLKTLYDEHHSLLAESTQKDMEALFAYLGDESDQVLKNDILSLMSIVLLAVRKKNAPDSTAEDLSHLGDIYLSSAKMCINRLDLLMENHRKLMITVSLIALFCVLLVVILYWFLPMITMYVVTQMAILSTYIVFIYLSETQHNNRLNIVHSFLESSNSDILCALSHMKLLGLLKKCPELMEQIVQCIEQITNMDKRKTILEDMIAILDWNPTKGTASMNAIHQKYAEEGGNLYTSFLLLTVAVLRHTVGDLPEDSHLAMVPYMSL